MALPHAVPGPTSSSHPLQRVPRSRTLAGEVRPLLSSLHSSQGSTGSAKRCAAIRAWMPEAVARSLIDRHSPWPSISGRHPSATRCTRRSRFQITAIGSFRSASDSSLFTDSVIPSSMTHVSTLFGERAPGRRRRFGISGEGRCPTTAARPRATAATTGKNAT